MPVSNSDMNEIVPKWIRDRLGNSTEYQKKQNDFQKLLWKECGKAVGNWLQERGSLSHPLYSLKEIELQGIAWAVICKFVEMREQKRKELQMPDTEGDGKWQKQIVDEFIGELKSID